MPNAIVEVLVESPGISAGAFADAFANAFAGAGPGPGAASGFHTAWQAWQAQAKPATSSGWAARQAKIGKAFSAWLKDAKSRLHVKLAFADLKALYCRAAA